MKKITLFFAVVLGYLNHSSAQIEVFDDLNTSVKAYAGYLHATSFSTDSLNVGQGGDFRVGGSYFWEATKRLSFSGFGVYDMNSEGQYTVTDFTVNLHLTSKVRLAVGKSARPYTYMRPYPTTLSGHFETWTQARIPGTALGGSILFGNFLSGSFGGIGVFQCDSGVEISGAIMNDKGVNGIGFYHRIFPSGEDHEAVQNGGVGVSKLFGDRLEALVLCDYYNEGDSSSYVMGTTLLGFFGSDRTFLVYGDMGGTLGEEFIRGEWGFVKVFSQKNFNSLVGLGYRYENRSVMGYLMVTL
ncbi:hypothetical protein KC842_01400 [Candidatus Nomurabacteria bacterium]|nr:hypothetical protein [Candidatus Nomurabacteria bacterium]USN94479.1 MAG: hypothetical protein H6791_01790 [Candidatus Nomurabacteria bacterium]